MTMANRAIQNVLGPSLVAVLAACSPEIIAATTTAGTTTSPGGEVGEASGETSGETSSEASGDESWTDDGEDEGGIFVPQQDLFEDTSCDPFAQDCPEGEKCVPYASTGGNWDANKCVPILGDGQPGEPCTYDGDVEATDSCGADSVCWILRDVDICLPFCSGSADEPICGPGYQCVIANSGSVNACLQICDPAMPECPEGLNCGLGIPEFVCGPFYYPDPYGMPCDIANCPGNQICIDASVLPECAASACCTQYCSLADPQCDWEGTECVPFFEQEPPPGYEDVGICIVPQP